MHALSLINCFATVLALSTPMALLPAWADQLDVIRVTCIPEMRYFEFEYKELPSEAVNYIDSGFEVLERNRATQIKKRWNNLKKFGFHSPKQLVLECKLPGSTYKLTADQGAASASGMCGSDPDISINLTHNGGSFISDTLLGPVCFEKPSIDRVEIYDGKEGWGDRNVTVCVRGNAPGVLGNCKSGLGLIHISQEKIEEFVLRGERSK